VLRQLLERKLIRVLGRKEIAGRPLIYATTKRFLETFDLKDLKDLPTPREVEEFGKPPLAERGYVTIEPDEETEPAGESLAGPAEQPPAEGTPIGDAAAQADGYDESTAQEGTAPPDETRIPSETEAPQSAENTSMAVADRKQPEGSDGMDAQASPEKKLDFGPERT